MALKNPSAAATAALATFAALTTLAACGGPATSSSASQPNTIRVVAAESFWGNLASQLGGARASVTSIVKDPNADPHEYETSTSDARIFASADYVIVNGAGYDQWGQKVLAANPRPRRVVLNVAELIGKATGDNPHFWYDPDYVSQVINRISADYQRIASNDAKYFQARLNATQTALGAYRNQLAAMRSRFGGTRIAATEDIVVYLASYLGLELISPPGLMQAVAEGNDPPANSVATFQDQLASRQPKVLVYNSQTVTAVTANLKRLAATKGIPVVGITETLVPPTDSFQHWMTDELSSLAKALSNG